MNEEKLIQISAEMEKKTEKLFKTYPCLLFGAEFEKSGSSRMSDFIFNEQYLWELGYTLETFSTTLLQEGIPE